MNTKAINKPLIPGILYALKKAWILFPLVSVLNYYLISKGMKNGFLDYFPSKIILTAIFPATCLYVGIIVGINLTSNIRNKK